MKDKILAAAQKLFLQHGYQAVSMRKIAKEIGYSATTIYIYFQNKADLLTQIAKNYFDDFLAQASDISKIYTEPATVLAEYLKLYCMMAFQNQHKFKFLASIFAEADKLKLGNTNSRQVLIHLQDLLEDCVKTGVLKIEDKGKAAESLWALLYGLSLLLVNRPYSLSKAENLINYTIDTHLTGMMKKEIKK